jgi:hypothetical protein
MSDSIKDVKVLERQLRRLIAIIVDQADKDPSFAARLAKVLNLSADADQNDSPKTRKDAFNPVEVLHHEGRESLQQQLEFFTDTKLKDILRQEGVKKQKGKKQFDRKDAILTITNQAQRRLHQGASFLQTKSGEEKGAF